MYKRSIEDPDGFWREIAMSNFHWETPIPEQHHAHNFDVNKARRGADSEAPAWLAQGCVSRHGAVS